MVKQIMERYSKIQSRLNNAGTLEIMSAGRKDPFSIVIRHPNYSESLKWHPCTLLTAGIKTKGAADAIVAEINEAGRYTLV